MSEEFDTTTVGDGSDGDDGDGPAIEFHGGTWMSALPILLFITWAIVQSALFRIGDSASWHAS